MKQLASIFILLVLLSFTHNFNPQSKEITQKYFPDFDYEINTPAFTKKKGFTNYNELMVFLNQLQASNSDKMQITFIGESQLGKKVPFVKISKANNQPKLKVWFQGGLHGNEMASTECVLFLLDKILNDPKLAYLLDKIDIAFVPMANIDGYEKQDRYAANGLDLNRDQTKLIIKESKFLKQCFSDFNPHVAIDFHEYNPYRKDFAQLGNNGVTSRYDVMFMSSGNLNVPQKLRDFTNEVFIKDAQKALSQLNLSFQEYSTTHVELGELHFSQGSNNARSSATSYALANTVSTLIEIRGVGIDRTSFKRRIYTGYAIGLSYLETAYQNFNQVLEVLNNANKEAKLAIVSSKKESSKQQMKFISLEDNEEVSIEVLVKNASKSSPTLSRMYPHAYLILPDNEAVVSRLKILGIKVDTLQNDTLISVESYLINAYKKGNTLEEGVYLQDVKADLVQENIRFVKGTFWVGLNQENANLAIEVLEPEAPNSFVLNSIIPAQLGSKLPIYRFVQK